MKFHLRFSVAILLFIAGKINAQNADPNAPVMQFDSLEYHFGSVLQGTEIRHRFHFTNTGKTDLIISNVASSDGGGVPVSWPKEPVKPGGSGIIELLQSTAGRMGAMDKVSTITSNNRDGMIVLHLKGNVYTDPNAPVLKFKTTKYDFRTVVQGTIITYEFQFTNTGKTPLVLQEMYTNTGAAVAEYPKEPIAPGKSGVIKYTFNTAGKMGPQNKSLVVNSNNRDGTIVLYITGKVEAKPAASFPPPSPK